MPQNLPNHALGIEPQYVFRFLFPTRSRRLAGGSSVALSYETSTLFLAFNYNLLFSHTPAQRNERPNVGGVSTRSRNGAPSRRLEKDAWPMVKCLRQSTNEYSPAPPLSPFFQCKLIGDDGSRFRIPKEPEKEWYIKYSIDLKLGRECCSRNSISFHYIDENLMRRLFHLIYSCPKEPVDLIRTLV